MLEKTHKGKIDVIYIDPPYNTGNKDFIYEDKMIRKDDGYRHSKWLSFMNERLQIARKLLSKQGIIFISIDDNEYSQLKILCDTIFNEENFIANIIWAKNSGNNNSLNVSIKTEYILVYGNDTKQLGKTFFSQRKKSFDDILELVRKCKNDGMSPEETQKELRNYYSKNKNIPNGTKQYIDSEYIHYTLDNIMEDLGCAKEKCVKVLAELDSKKGIGLIEKKRQGLGKTDIIYVKNFATLEVGREPESQPKSHSNTDVSTEVRKSNFKRFENRTLIITILTILI